VPHAVPLKLFALARGHQWAQTCDDITVGMLKGVDVTTIASAATEEMAAAAHLWIHFCAHSAFFFTQSMCVIA
jgi:hypothetical protein